jgi:high-affinity nickel-transport protein
VTVGFWFSLGHSSVVFGLSLVAATGIRLVTGAVLQPGSMFTAIAGRVGTNISSGFLYLIATSNALAFLSFWKIFRRSRTAEHVALSTDDSPRSGGLLSWVLRPVSRCVSAPWHMYFVGLLFGLGFDTATEIAFLALSASTTSRVLPWHLQLCFPLLFAAGMVLFDSLDGILINSAYAWAVSNSRRRLHYNLIITWSIVVAVVVATSEAVTVLRDQLPSTKWLPQRIDQVD